MMNNYAIVTNVVGAKSNNGKSWKKESIGECGTPAYAKV
jgi:hypothetical protein